MSEHESLRPQWIKWNGLVNEDDLRRRGRIECTAEGIGGKRCERMQAECTGWGGRCDS